MVLPFGKVPYHSSSSVPTRWNDRKSRRFVAQGTTIRAIHICLVIILSGTVALNKSLIGHQLQSDTIEVGEKKGPLLFKAQSDWSSWVFVFFLFFAAVLISIICDRGRSVLVKGSSRLVHACTQHKEGFFRQLQHGNSLKY